MLLPTTTLAISAKDYGVPPISGGGNGNNNFKGGKGRRMLFARTKCRSLSPLCTSNSSLASNQSFSSNNSNSNANNNKSGNVTGNKQARNGFGSLGRGMGGMRFRFGARCGLKANKQKPAGNTKWYIKVLHY